MIEGSTQTQPSPDDTIPRANLADVTRIPAELSPDMFAAQPSVQPQAEAVPAPVGAVPPEMAQLNTAVVAEQAADQPPMFVSEAAHLTQQPEVQTQPEHQPEPQGVPEPAPEATLPKPESRYAGIETAVDGIGLMKAVAEKEAGASKSFYELSTVYNLAHKKAVELGDREVAVMYGNMLSQTQQRENFLQLGQVVSDFDQAANKVGQDRVNLENVGNNLGVQIANLVDALYRTGR